MALLGDEAEKVSEKILGLAEVGSLGPGPALFQTGYLTIDKVTAFDGGGTAFTMKIQNLEIKRTNIPLFEDTIYGLLGRDPATEKDAFRSAVVTRDQARLTEIMDSVFAGLPAEHHSNNESCYRKVLYGYCHKFGRIVIPERKGAIGNSDLVVILPGRLYAVIELKFDAGDETPNQARLVSRLALEALAAIEKKDYWRPFRSEAKELVKIGLGVSYRGQCLALVAGSGPVSGARSSPQ
ncbi:MAG: PD-(D/E)XK nuclease domain-containing protein [Deltaproteobacteria bacterium]|nr:PD-(D/E)XK nuclease domain-containing protein [Deltaproteobacteria bacterium]